MAVTNVGTTDTFEQWRGKTNTLGTDVGDISSLQTTASNLVAAINELKNASVTDVSLIKIDDNGTFRIQWDDGTSTYTTKLSVDEDGNMTLSGGLTGTTGTFSGAVSTGALTSSTITASGVIATSASDIRINTNQSIVLEVYNASGTKIFPA